MSGFKEGELLISSTPYAHVLYRRYRRQFCDYCFKKNNKLKRCGQCNHLYYCNKNCQTQAWKMHKMECKFLKGHVLPDTTTRLTMLVLMKVRKYGFEEPFEDVGNRRVTMRSLESDAEYLRDSIETMVVKKTIELYIGSNNLPPFDEFLEILGKLNSNVFVIDNGGPLGTLGAYGVGLYLKPLCFDNSCDPDAAYTFDGTTLNVRMMRSVPHRDINQVRISYHNELTFKERRINGLFEAKSFTCSCPICTSLKSDKLLHKLVCDTPKIKSKARKCKKEVEDLLSNFPNLDEPELLYDECIRLLASQSGVLAETNIYRIRTLEKAFNASLKLANEEDAVEFASQLEKPYRMYYSTNHPILGGFLMKYGMCLSLLRRIPEALPILSEAETKLRVIYGEDHPIVLSIKKRNDLIYTALSIVMDEDLTSSESE